MDNITHQLRKRRILRSKSGGGMVVPASPLIRLWLLRLLVPLGGHRRFIRDHGFGDDEVCEIVGLGHWIEPGDREFKDMAVLAELRSLHARAEAWKRPRRAPANLAKNVKRLAALVGLTQAEMRVLEFAVLLHSERVIDDTADFVGPFSTTRMGHALAVVLGLPQEEIRGALSSRGALARSGLVTIDRTGINGLRGKIELLSSRFADLMLTEAADPVSLLRDTVSLSEPPTLAMEDFDHLSEPLEILRPYLRRSVESRRKGVNVLIHGEPGTGKTQLARLLAKELGCPLYEIASEDAEGDPVNGERRLRAFRAAQSFFAARPALVLFDETEDVFNDGDGPGRRSTAQKRKAWMNRMLESNPVPTLWLSNWVHSLDPAFVRRFDVVLEMSVPPRRKRERIIQAACGDLVDARTSAMLASAKSLSPAVIARAASVAGTVRDLLPEDRLGPAVVSLVEGTLVAQGHRPLMAADAARLPPEYDPGYINADADLAAVAEGLARTKSGRLCLYGPPGTGKSAFGRWVADRLGAPLDLRRISDIVSPWLGVTEQNLAKAFREAQRAGAVLLLDEVDSFLRDRRGAVRSWEVTEVNEMLTQMESFGGVFIATTNLMDDLDQAALRRFDLKLRFDFLLPAQARRMFETQCFLLNLGEPDADALEGVARLGCLTPGDFAAVVRQHRFRQLASPLRLLEALERETALKEGAARKAIGFR